MSNEQVTTALMAPFAEEEYETRPDSGHYTYVAGENILRRLISATDNQFDVKIHSAEPRIIANQDGTIKGELWTARITLTIAGLGSRDAIGVQMMYPKSGEDMLKGCVTDAIKKAATYFGVGLELYDDEPAAASGDRKPASNPDDWTAFWGWLVGTGVSPQDYAKIVGKTANLFENPKAAYHALLKVRPELGVPPSTAK